MHCMMTEFLGDWPKPKTLDRLSLGPLRRRSGEAGDAKPGPGAGFRSCESIPARAERARLLRVCPSPARGLGARVRSLGSSPPSASVCGAAGGSGHLRACVGLPARPRREPSGSACLRCRSRALPCPENTPERCRDGAALPAPSGLPSLVGNLAERPRGKRKRNPPGCCTALF